MKKLIIFGNGKITEAVYNSMSDDKSFNYKIECFCVEKNIKKNKFLGLPNYDFETIEKNFLHQNIFLCCYRVPKIKSNKRKIFYRAKKKDSNLFLIYMKIINKT